MDREATSDTPEGEDRYNKLADLFGSDGPPDLDEIRGPVHWPNVPADEAGQEWVDLRVWVEELIARFAHLDHHVIPACWWQHNGHVEALAALKDHERICYTDSSPATAAVDWHRAFRRDIESRLREWTGGLSCGPAHDPRTRPPQTVNEDDWAPFVADDIDRRRQTAIQHAVSDK